MKSTDHMVMEYARMWPRAMFDMKVKGVLVVRGIPILQEPGVYVLYRDDVPYYIGKSNRKLLTRLHDHANKLTDRYFNLWNYFSVFAVMPKHIDDVEGILIAAMPTANSAAPKIKQATVPVEIRDKLRRTRQARYE